VEKRLSRTTESNRKTTTVRGPTQSRQSPRLPAAAHVPDNSPRVLNTAAVTTDPAPNLADRTLTRHIRSGALDLILIALLWVSLPPPVAAIVTGLLALVWTTQFVGYRMAVQQARREAAAPEEPPDARGRKPGERRLLIYLVISTVALYSILISGGWIGVRFDALPVWLAIGVTAFLLAGAIWMGVSLTRATRRILHERNEGNTTP